MIERKEMDKQVGIKDQVSGKSTQPTISVNVLTVEPKDVDQFVTSWKIDADYFKRQPGFISTQLHRGIEGSCTFLNYVTWESVVAFGEALSNREFQSTSANYPSSTTTSPHLFRKLAVKGLCLD